MTAFTTDDIALRIELRGVYDGTAVYLLKSGEWVNRFRQSPGWGASRIAAVDKWIAEHGDRVRAANDATEAGGADG